MAWSPLLTRATNSVEHLCADGERGILALDDDGITRGGGCGGHEIRPWIAIANAARVAGIKRFDLKYYRAIPQWVAG